MKVLKLSVSGLPNIVLTVLHGVAYFFNLNLHALLLILVALLA